jgi:RimJ/RimL family protein N-acetyltransferase
VILRHPRPTVIGIVAPKGPPDEQGTVQVTCAIASSREGNGYATEAMKALLDWICRDPRTRRITGETQPAQVASIAVMEKCGMSFVGEGSAPGSIRYGKLCRRLNP